MHGLSIFFYLRYSYRQHCFFFNLQTKAPENGCWLTNSVSCKAPGSSNCINLEYVVDGTPCIGDDTTNDYVSLFVNFGPAEPRHALSLQKLQEPTDLLRKPTQLDLHCLTLRL